MAFRLAGYKGDEAKLKNDIVNEVKRLCPSNMHVPVGKYRVGLKSSTRLCIDELEKMGPMNLIGIGGVGKTTLCEAIYNYYAHMKKYPFMTFLHDVRCAFSEVEVGRKGHLVELQNQLLWDLLRVKDNSPQEYNLWIHKLLSRGPVFIVLDNIDSKDQFEKLIPDVNHLGQGSRIILTSRDKSMLSVMPTKFPTFQHAVKPLGSCASQRLFNWHAFDKEIEPPEEFQDLATNVANACHGLPLALKVVGSSLAGKGTTEDRQNIWSEAVEYLKENSDVMRSLQWSYDHLPSKSGKLMFQDIACTLHNIDKTSAMACWEACKHCPVCPGFRNPRSSLQCLFERCLLKEDEHRLIMHDFLQDMAKKTVREQSQDPREQSLQFDVQVAEQIVAENDGTKHIRSMTLAGSKRKFRAEEFEKMERLHYLVVDGCEVSGDFKRFPKRLRYLQWRAMPYSQIPTTLDLSSLSVLDLSMSDKLVNLWSSSKLPIQNLSNLRILKMDWCSSITALPEAIGELCKLNKLDLDGCTSLTNLPISIGQLKELRKLSLTFCKSLELLPSSIGVLTNLESLGMNWCTQLKSLPDSLGKLSSLRDLNLIGNWSLTELPESLGNLLNLEKLILSNCEGLECESFPDTLCKLSSLRVMQLGNCSSLGEIPAFVEELTNLEHVGLEECDLGINSLDSFSRNMGLKTLDLRFNRSITCLPELVRCLPHLEEVDLSEDNVDLADVPNEFMIELHLYYDNCFTICRKKSLAIGSDALPTN